MPSAFESSAFERAKLYSNQKLDALRSTAGALLPLDAIGITVGSYARREASRQSDLDYFVVTTAKPLDTTLAEAFRKAVRSEVEKPAAPGGPFDEIVADTSLLNDIGGDVDSNQTITRRMLFLLEGEWLSNEAGFRSLRREMRGRYVQDSLSDHKIALFLLNDIIRYWRTITVDYEHKTMVGDKPKPWAIRKLKLTFSRKLLYAGGLFSVGRTADLTPARKIDELDGLLAQPALERVEHICGAVLSGPIRDNYERFLDRMEDDGVRRALDALPRNDADEDETFRDLNNESHRYTRALLTAFETTFHSTHPIRRAVIF